MSYPLAIACITAILKEILANGLASELVSSGMGDVAFTALPLDQVVVSGDDRPQLNIFLYHVSQNPNADMADQQSEPARAEIREISLALNLHYLLTAYGTKNFQSELLLGYAIQLFHDTPNLAEDRINKILKHAKASNPSDILSQALGKVSIDDISKYLGTIKLCPELLSVEEMSKLWSSLQTHYRPSIAYRISTLLLKRTSSVVGQK